MPDFKPWIKPPRVWIVVGVVLILTVVLVYFSLVRAQAAPAQPIAFNHSLHVGLRIQCLYCHPGAIHTPVAGLPTLAKCMGCHNQIEANTPGKQKLAQYAETNTSIPWVPVAIQPDFVYFSHQPHIKFGLNCETCHGDVGSMTVAEPQPDHNMGWCLNCHQELAPERFVKLSDCATCHF